VNGTIQGSYWVYTQDLSILKKAYYKNNAALAPIVGSVGTTGTIMGICADLNHAPQGSYRVYTQDLTRLKLYYYKTVANVPCCDYAAPAGDCTLVAGDAFNYWTN
jgi:hypothetical protein